uniref:Uncharacterized protein n=1 Tax=Glossina austeni TaxID=7395 RepID=A0A1A9URB1_GLOAU
MVTSADFNGNVSRIFVVLPVRPQPETVAAVPSTGTAIANGVDLILELNVKSSANRTSAISLAKFFALKLSCNLKPATCIKLPSLFQKEDPARTFNLDGVSSPPIMRPFKTDSTLDDLEAPQTLTRAASMLSKLYITTIADELLKCKGVLRCSTKHRNIL